MGAGQIHASRHLTRSTLIADLPVITYAKGESLRELSRHVIDGVGHLVEVGCNCFLPIRIAVFRLGVNNLHTHVDPAL